MTIKYHRDIVQGSEEWRQSRCGILTASKMSKLITPTLKVAANDDSRRIVYEIMCERITGIVQDEFQSFDMMRGHEEEIYARQLYSKTYEPVEEVGFITNDRLGFVMGWSPDGLVGDDGLIQIKSRKNELQIKLIMEGIVPNDNVIQLQSELFVSERKWVDYISYSNGLPMWTKRVEPIAEVQDAIRAAAIQLEWTVSEKIKQYKSILSDPFDRFIETERKEYDQEMHV